MKLLAVLALIGAISDSYGFTNFFATTESPFSKYPIWKVHKYSGLQLKPVNRPEIYPDIHTKEVIAEEVPDVVSIDHDESPGLLASFFPGDGKMWARQGKSAPVAEEKTGLLALPALSHLKKKKKRTIGALGLYGLLKATKDKFVGAEVVEEPVFPYPAAEAPYPAALPAVPAEQLVYRDVPSEETGFLSGLFGKWGKKSTVVHLPEPILPKIPAFKLVPEPPKLPKVTLAGYHEMPYTSGTYVSIKFPKPQILDEHINYAPAPEYGLPLAPAPEYGLPLAPAPEYGIPHAPAPEYGLPHAPAPEYGLPHAPAPEYGLPHAPAPTYGVPLAPAPEYGLPHAPAPEYGVPFAPPPTYGVSAHEYGVPLAPAPEYGTPVQIPVVEVIQDLPAPVAPAGFYAPPIQEYGPAPAPGSYSSVASNYPQTYVGTSYDVSSSASESKPIVVYPEKETDIEKSQDEKDTDAN